MTKSVFDLALARLRALFPASRMVANLGAKGWRRPREDVAMLTHYSMRACPFPAVAKYGLCRGHLAESSAQYSVLPSALGAKTRPATARMTFTTE